MRCLLFHKSPLFFCFSLVILITCSSPAQSILTESQLIALAQKENPRFLQIEANNQSIKGQQFATKSQFDPQLNSTYSYSASNEQAIIQFAPVFKPQKIFNVGISQQTSLGADFKFQGFSQQISTANGFINNATQTGIQLGVEIDLWKNFLGSLDRAQLESARLGKEVSDLQSEIDRHSYILEIRKLYWTLAANQLSLELSEELVKTAQTQVKDAKNKLKEGLGDPGDVARNKGQLQGRDSAALFYAYQKEILISQLKSQIPSLSGKEVVIDSKLTSSMENRARTCVAQIASQKTIPVEYSKFDEVVALLDEQMKKDLMISENTDTIDFKLQAQYQASGVDQSHGEAYQELVDRFRNGYQVGASLRVPLGGELKQSRQAQVNATVAKYEAQKQSLSLNLKAEYEKMVRAMNLLVKASQSQDATIKSLRTSLKSTKKKFRQARVSLNTYILEQDNLFNSELQLIETKRQILHLVLDFFKIFNQYPCSINTQLKEAQS